MNKFITYREKDEAGILQYYILQKDFPHIIGIIDNKPSEGNWYSPIAGYYLYVVFNYTLRGKMIPSYKNIGEEISAVLDSMATWFCAERILPDEKKYKKFKINQDVSIKPQ